MGKTAADVQYDIEGLRKETDLLVAELQSRLKRATSISAQVEDHPVIATGVGLALLGGLTFAGYAVYERVKDERKPATRLRQRAGDVKEALGEKARGVAQTFPAVIVGRRDDSLLKRMLYAGLMAAAVTLASYLARRIVDGVWTKTMQERPPGEAR